MRVFVCEYVTAGGMRDKPLPETLLPEGTLMRDAIVSDLEELPGVSVLMCHDDRLPTPRSDSMPIPKGKDPWVAWSSLAHEAHVIWPVAPETAGLLTRMVRLMRESGARVIACSPDAIGETSSKLNTYRKLSAAGIACVPTYPLDEIPAGLDGDLVTKPDMGAGAENTRAWPSRKALPRGAGLIVQPFVPGTAASLSVLVRPDGVTLLTVNKQHIQHLVGVISLRGLTVGAIPDPDGRYAELARKVVAALPGLSGIIGIDIILTPEGPVVLEVNPRITTSYAGLHASLGINPAAFLPELIRDGTPPAVPHLPTATPVDVGVR